MARAEGKACAVGERPLRSLDAIDPGHHVAEGVPRHSSESEESASFGEEP